MIKKILSFAVNPILRTVMMGLTGAFLCFFLCIHIIGNYLLFAGGEVYNNYSHFLLSLPILPVIEGALVICVLYHAIVGVWAKFKNRHDARDRGYGVKRNAPMSRRNIASRTAHITGILILVGLVAHVWSMKFGEPDIPGPERDIAAYVIDMFGNGWVVVAYLVILSILGVHLFHGLGTLYESFGIAHRRWLRRIGQGFAILLWAAYFIFPILVYFIF